jgi:hypothetical protein
MPFIEILKLLPQAHMSMSLKLKMTSSHMSNSDGRNSSYATYPKLIIPVLDINGAMFKISDL